MKLLYNNQVYKYGWVPMQLGEAKVIDNNALAEKKIQEQLQEFEHEFEEPASDFREGLTPEEIAAIVDAGFNDGIDADGNGNVIKAPQGAEQALEEAQAQIDEMMQQAQAEIEEMRNQAQFEINMAREQAEAQGYEKGYQEGMTKGHEEGYRDGQQEGIIEGRAEGQHSFDEKKAELEKEYQEKREAVLEQYEQKVSELEPRFVSTLTAIYEHIFNVNLKKNQDIIVHLIGNTMRNIEGDSGYLIHVSKEDYPYVSIQKKDMLQGCGIALENVEIIEDATLGRNECMIETGSGVFDCSLGTEMAALHEQLQLLAFHPEQGE